jgi:hypothetical protein
MGLGVGGEGGFLESARMKKESWACGQRPGGSEGVPMKALKAADSIIGGIELHAACDCRCWCKLDVRTTPITRLNASFSFCLINPLKPPQSPAWTRRFPYYQPPEASVYGRKPHCTLIWIMKIKSHNCLSFLPSGSYLVKFWKKRKRLNESLLFNCFVNGRKPLHVCIFSLLMKYFYCFISIFKEHWNECYQNGRTNLLCPVWNCLTQQAHSCFYRRTKPLTDYFYLNRR